MWGLPPRHEDIEGNDVGALGSAPVDPHPENYCATAFRQLAGTLALPPLEVLSVWERV